MRLFLEIIDLSNDTIIDVKEIHSSHQLNMVNAWDAASLEKYGWADADYDIVLKEIDTEILAKNVKFRVRIGCEADDLPYLVHTGRELDLMLKGIKPLAVFNDVFENDTNMEFKGETKFRSLVKSGVFMDAEYSYPDRETPGYTVRYKLYALKSEVWRIPAYILLVKTVEKTGWNSSLEYYQGRLLGYSENECDIYLESLTRKAAG
jgi:hypothetical protein